MISVCFSKSEHDTTEVASGGRAQTEEPASSKLATTSSRGRSSTRAGNKRGRSSANPVKRVQRRRGKQPSKIGGSETEESDAASEEKASTRLSDDISEETGDTQRNSRRGRSAKRGKSRVAQPQRVQRSRRGKKPLKIGGDDSEENDDKKDGSADEENKEETREPDVAKHRESLQRDDTVAVEEASSQDSRNAKTEMDREEKIQIHEDPLQAMLMNMIPSLSLRNTSRTTGEASTANVCGEGESSEKRKLGAETDNACVKNAEADEVPPPVKKKKVSYRDVAGELLKDW